MALIFRPTSAAAVKLRPAAKRMADKMRGKGVSHTVEDGFILRAVGTGEHTIVTVIDTPQMLICPTYLRVPYKASSLTVAGSVVAAGARDVWQAGHTPVVAAPPVLPNSQLPSPDLDLWRFGISRGFEFEGAGDNGVQGWSEHSDQRISVLTAHASGYDITANTHDGKSYPDWFNASNPARVKFSARRWSAYTVSVSREAFESGETVNYANRDPLSSVSFSTGFVDEQVSGWTAILRAHPDFTEANPMYNAPRPWGVAHRLAGNAIGPVHYLIMCRLFPDIPGGATSNRPNEFGALWVATVKVALKIEEDGSDTITGDVLSSLIVKHDGWQYPSPMLAAVGVNTPPLEGDRTVWSGSFPGISFACYVARPASDLTKCHADAGCHIVSPAHKDAATHALLLSPINRGGSDSWYGISRHTVVVAPVSGNVRVLHTDLQLDGSNGFAGGDSVDGVTSHWLDPWYNNLAPESPTGQMRVLSCDGSTITTRTVETPQQFARPAWGRANAHGFVHNIGGGNLSFLITLAPFPTVGSLQTAPFDITFCVYNPDTDAIEVRGQIAHVTQRFRAGYPTAGDILGGVTVVQKTVKRAGKPDTEAVLLWSANSGADPGGGGTARLGITYVSYDSGRIWHQLSDSFGGGRGVIFAGSALRPVAPGQAWTLDEAMPPPAP